MIITIMVVIGMIHADHSTLWWAQCRRCLINNNKHSLGLMLQGFWRAVILWAWIRCPPSGRRLWLVRKWCWADPKDGQAYFLRVFHLFGQVGFLIFKKCSELQIPLSYLYAYHWLWNVVKGAWGTITLNPPALSTWLDGFSFLPDPLRWWLQMAYGLHMY